MRYDSILAIAIGAMAALILLTISWEALLALLLAGIVLSGILRNPLWGLMGFAFLAAAIPYSTIQLGIRITISEAVLALTWLGVLWQIPQGRIQIRLRHTEKALLVLMIFSVLPFVVGQIVIPIEGNGLVNWARWLLNLSTLFLVCWLADSPKKTRQLLWAVLLGGAMMMALSIMIFLQSRNAMDMLPILEILRYANLAAATDIFSSFHNRMGSPWVHPNLLGGFLVMVLPVAYVLAIEAADRRLKTLALAISLLALCSLFLSLSRGAMVSLSVVTLWLNRRRIPYTGHVFGLGIILGIVLVLVYPPLQERLANAFTANNASNNLRIKEYLAFPQVMELYPLGIGFKIDPPVAGGSLLGISNLWLNYIYKIGLLGMILFVRTTLWWRREVWPKNLTHDPTQLQIGLIASIVAVLLTGFMDHYFSFTPVLIGLFWLFIGLSLQIARQAANNKDGSTYPKTCHPLKDKRHFTTCHLYRPGR
ncbi:MAG: O-antigen ligase domain-containing protein [Candidatus Competibacteraceae bacterium]|nr:O-antigen ligase domain-containing protein [Candidatus Competibacteraceae bacterium]